MKNLYEVFDEFEESKTEQERIDVIGRNLSQHLVEALQYAYHPSYVWKYKELPKEYKIPDAPPGMAFSNIGKELKKMYLFRDGDPAAERLTDRRRLEILLQMLESLEPREMEVIVGIFKKDLGVKGLNYKFIKKVFPNLLP
jgi:hypothetical protein